ncbi:WD repeat domain phosphoinositide-interacting protein 2-like isoform X1 [Pecten maximus]|uniref:WD repeat domain phosphoinositide-interacting protein 2-like isoform X1 n=1 Tax=Pecten maximus TaxID=6579 RepID=UPI00145908CB|nr:WD repeat domain phosphoinositide-interacting protein 2-like isoform X1 [Pecten maximus]
MNIAAKTEDEQSELLFVNFNQDCTSLAIGTRTGYKLFSLSSVDKLEQIYENENEDICIVERLFSSSLVAIVSLSSPRKLKVCHFKKGTEICNYSYSNSILAVRLNRQRLIVCLEESLYIHNIRDMKVLHTIRDTPPNRNGLCALSINNDNCFLAYPGSNQIGEVQIFDTMNLRAVIMIPAHDNPLAALAFNNQGTKIATASEKGTVIRVFSVPEGQKLFEFRRGVKRCASIHSLAFSIDSMFLSASSNTETVHVFKLEIPKDRPQEEPQTWVGYFGQALKSSATYLPSQVTEMFNQGRAFATSRLPTSGLRNVCALTVIQKVPRLLVASQDGYLHIYNLDPNEGGECMLLRQHRLDGKLGEVPGEMTPHDKPLTAAGTSYASTVRRPDPSPPGTATPVPPGKPSGTDALLPQSPTTYSPVAHSPRSSYANMVKRMGGPQEVEVGLDDEQDPMDLIDEILNGAESQPYQEVEQGAMGGDGSPGLGQLRLDDDNEFPPMTHKND